MRKIVLVLFLGSIVGTSCADKEKRIKESQVQAKIDSLVGIRVNQLAVQSMEDLDRRMSIEVKPKADSIFAAWKAGNASAAN